MKYIGAHVDSPDGLSSIPGAAASLGASAFALYTGGGKMFSGMPAPEEAARFQEACRAHGFAPEAILPHANLFLNLGSPDGRKLALARKSFLEELRRCEALGLIQLNVHAGSHLNTGVDACLDRIAESINLGLDQTRGVRVLVENAAGQGTNVGASFAELARIIEGVEDKDRVGVCIDTCHAYSAGYNLADEAGWDATWREFDATIGARYLGALHLNDDQKTLGSRIDRHASLGRGTIGPAAFARIARDARFEGLPLVLETPDPLLWPEEIAWMREKADKRA